MRRVAPFFVAVALLSGCKDYGIYDPDRRFFEGYYTYAGTVEGRFGHTISGEIIIERQRGGVADVWIDWTYYELGEPLFRIVSDFPALADVDPDGDIDFEFEGELLLYGEIVWFRLIHDGRLSRRAIHGDWLLETDLPSTDYGSFTASR